MSSPESHDARFRRLNRLRNARSWLHFASGFAVPALIVLVVRGPWMGIPVVLGVVLLLQLARYWIGRVLPPPTEPMYVTDLKG
jgi:hypothetical protein